MCPVICPHQLEGYVRSLLPLDTSHILIDPPVLHGSQLVTSNRSSSQSTQDISILHASRVLVSSIQESYKGGYEMDTDNGTYDLALQPSHPHLGIACLPQESSLDVFSDVPTPPRLPQELCDIIIDELAYFGSEYEYWSCDNRALKQCALVCRAWTPRAQLWLSRFIALSSVESLRKLEAQLCLREEYVPEIQAICIFIGERNRGYPIRNLAHAVTTLARRCFKLQLLEVVGTCVFEPGDSKFHPFLPFHSRIHSTLYRQSFSTVTDLRLINTRFHSDTDFLNLLLSFPALRELFLFDIFCNISGRVKECNYILLMKKRKAALGKLRRLGMIYLDTSVFSAVLEILENEYLQGFVFEWPFQRDDASSSLGVSRFTSLAHMEARLLMQGSEYWERDEFTALSFFLKGAFRPTKVLVLNIYLDRIDCTRQEAMKAFEGIGKLVSEDYTEGHSVSVHMILRFFPLSERVEGSPLRDEITNVFPESVTIRVDIETNDAERSAWSCKPENSGTDTIAAQDKPIYPRERGRRHSFPPPSSYSPTNTPRWGLSLPHKDYTSTVPFTNEWQLSRFDRLLPDGELFEPPKRDGEGRHDFAQHGPGSWWRWDIDRRMSGSFEGLLADTAKARNPAFIAPYRAPREPVLARASLR